MSNSTPVKNGLILAAVMIKLTLWLRFLSSEFFGAPTPSPPPSEIRHITGALQGAGIYHHDMVVIFSATDISSWHGNHGTSRS